MIHQAATPACCCQLLLSLRSGLLAAAVLLLVLLVLNCVVPAWVVAWSLLLLLQPCEPQKVLLLTSRWGLDVPVGPCVCSGLVLLLV